MPQAEALDELLKKKHIKLDAVVELRVNESALLQRVETRVAEMRARGEEVRIDDTPEVLTKRLASYRSLTEPLIHYYSERRKLLTVDGMMTIEHVTREINRILAAIGAMESKAAKRPARPPRRASKPGAGNGFRQDAPGRRSRHRKAAKAGKTAAKGGEKAVPEGSASSRARPSGRSGKAPKRSRKSELKHRDG